MTRWKHSLLWLLLGVSIIAATGLGEEALPEDERRAALRKLVEQGNFNEAYEGYKKLALEPDSHPWRDGGDLQMATQCLANLGRLHEIDELSEQVIAAHKTDWRLLQSAAENYLALEHSGFIIAGKFERGGHRGGGRQVHAFERDRVRALQLMQDALALLDAEPDQEAKSGFYMSLAGMLLSNRGYSEAWRLQSLTDLATLPDYEEGWYGWWGWQQQTRGAPVDAEGNPIFHRVPESWQTAKSDGERWRWSLLQAQEMSAGRKNQVRWELAQFHLNQFGPQTMADYGWFFGREADHEEPDESGTFELHTLAEDETIARLATGIKRFKLPDEFNYIRYFQAIAADPQTGYWAESLDALAGEFENRRQYETAADYWRKGIAAYGAKDGRPERLEQIVGNWGRFEPESPQPAGTGAELEYRFRNGKKVAFEARPIKVDMLLSDLKEHLKSRPKELDWNKVNIGDIGYRLVVEKQTQYLDDPVANWDLDLEPRPRHFDRRITVTTPLQKAGAYLVTATIEGGKKSHVVCWVADTVLVKKPLSGKTYYYVADAVTGQPIAKANVEFFGYRTFADDQNRFRIETKNYAELTDADGQLVMPAKDDDQNYQWLIMARTRQGRLAFHGFTGVWTQQIYDPDYEQTKVFTITDRPVYRPGQEVKFKFWVRHAKYDQEDSSSYAKHSFAAEIHSPQGEKILSQSFTADDYGGFDGTFKLPEDAQLGMYQLFVVDHGGGSFRVEEYKKPEYEVTIAAPEKPVMLGEKITAKIEAKYYFGSPVTEAKVKYKITRTSLSQTWYPIGRWDWLYGRGYWWFAYDYAWYPGWGQWGCVRPMPIWWWRPSPPPEIVAEVETQVGADGTVPIEIDTAVAKAVHGNTDHEYQITAEVIDASRRTIVGTGSVKVARAPFKVFVWLDRGYYRAGDTVRANASAHTIDERPVTGTGKFELFKITYDDENQPVETSVETWDVHPNEAGQAELQLEAAGGGQYRLAYTVDDGAGHTIEGAYLYSVIGQGFKSADYRFNNIELIPDKQDYASGDKVKLLVNTDRVGSTVLFFTRPVNGVYLPPQVFRLKAKSTLLEIDVSKKDMPNFFVEAVTIADGGVHTEAKEIVVPPEQRVLDVAVSPSSETYKPGEEASVQVKLTDVTGEPFVGSSVVAIYDKSVEYISGGSNVPEIKEFFWKWRRSHSPHRESSLDKYASVLVPPGEAMMADLGVFGATVTSELTDLYAAEGAMLGEGKAMARGARQAMAGAMPAPGAMADSTALESAAGFGGGSPGGALGADDGGGGAPLVQPTVRSNFADTALWVAAITTDLDGTALVNLTMPENLSTWKVKVWGMGHGTKVGQGEAEVVTRKNLILRLQAPRFFVEKDEVVLSANVHNYLDAAKDAQVVLELDGGAIEPIGETTQTVHIEAGGEARVDWRVKVVREGEALVRMKALTDTESDAMEMRFPVYVHGMLKLDIASGALRPSDEAGQFTIQVPEERRINESRLEVRYSPTLAGAMVDALPYLVDYPYGCTEQTLNRFLPTVITQKVLIGMGLDLKEIQEKRTNLNAQELGDPAERAAQWKRYERNPVFDQAEVDKMVKEGVRKLTEMQLSDGGWGWFSGWGEYSSPHTTATVVHGLQVAVANDVAVVPDVLSRGIEWLKNYQDEQVRHIKNAPTKTIPYKLHADDLDAFVYMVLVDSDVANEEMREFLYRDRTHLAAYTKAMFGLALHKQGKQDELAMILRNLEQYLVQDEENQTAYLQLPEGIWWYWYGSEFEAQAYYLKLLTRTDPKGEVASRLVKYLLNNRKHATYWNSTRDSALCVEAFAEFLKASGEDKPSMTVEVWLDGEKKKEVAIDAENLFSFDGSFVLEGDAIESGSHTIELKKRGTGPLYYNGYLTTFTLEDFISKAGLEIKVERKVYKLVQVDKQIDVAGDRGQVVGQKVEKFERVLLDNDAVLTSGDLVEIELEIESKNDYEYLIFEDMKAAGFEPVEFTSGYNGNDLGAYVEFRDERVSFFSRQLARGNHSVAYRLRAEIPGRFSALPTKAHAMYAPELKANSDEIKLRIEDEEIEN